MNKDFERSVIELLRIRQKAGVALIETYLRGALEGAAPGFDEDVESLETRLLSTEVYLRTMFNRNDDTHALMDAWSLLDIHIDAGAAQQWLHRARANSHRARRFKFITPLTTSIGGANGLADKTVRAAHGLRIAQPDLAAAAEEFRGLSDPLDVAFREWVAQCQCVRSHTCEGWENTLDMVAEAEGAAGRLSESARSLYEDILAARE